MKIILATTSPGRISLFNQLGLPFESVAPVGVTEEIKLLTSPEELVFINASRKAELVAKGRTEGLVIGCDTLAFLDGKVLGKPYDAKHAKQMLSELNGKTHLIVTGLAAIDCASGEKEFAFDKTLVTFKSVSGKQIEEYAESGEPLGKAGAYAFQGMGGALLVKKIDGSPSNVVGLPLEKLFLLLEKFGVKPPAKK